jgi:hypothetical protein
MAVAWPAEVNTRVHINGFTEAMERNVVEFKPEVGPPKQRRRSSISTELLVWPSAYTEAEWLALKEFVRVDLADGTLAFERNDPLTGELDDFIFVEAPKISSVQGPYFFVDLQLRRLP